MTIRLEASGASRPRALAIGVALSIVIVGEFLVAPKLAGAEAIQCGKIILNVVLESGSAATHKIAGTLCRPDAPRASGLQILLSGATYGREYWNFRCDRCAEADRYSYVKATTGAGWATLNLDRIGIGDSEHPSDAQISLGSESYATHQIIQTARRGRLGDGVRYRRVILVGHSLGSAIAVLEATQYPKDVDGLLLTGFLHGPPFGGSAFVASFEPAQAEARLADRPIGYLTTQAGTRGITLYYPPGTESSVVDRDESTKQTTTITEFTTFARDGSDSSTAAAIRIPVLSVVGEFDNVFCPSSCAAEDGPAYQEGSFYPKATCFEPYVLPQAGHVINLHISAPQWFAVARAWLGRRIGGVRSCSSVGL